MKYVVILRVNGKVLEVWRCKTKSRFIRIKKMYMEMAKQFENSEIEARTEE